MVNILKKKKMTSEEIFYSPIQKEFSLKNHVLVKMIYKVKITYKVTNLEGVPGSCIINKKSKNKFVYIYKLKHINNLIHH